MSGLLAPCYSFDSQGEVQSGNLHGNKNMVTFQLRGKECDWEQWRVVNNELPTVINLLIGDNYDQKYRLNVRENDAGFCEWTLYKSDPARKALTLLATGEGQNYVELMNLDVFVTKQYQEFKVDITDIPLFVFVFTYILCRLPQFTFAAIYPRAELPARIAEIASHALGTMKSMLNAATNKSLYWKTTPKGIVLFYVTEEAQPDSDWLDSGIL